MSKIVTCNRKSAFADLKDFCVFAMGQNASKGYYLEVTEWTNGEGVDVIIQNVGGEKVIKLTWGELDALNKCVETMQTEN